MSDHDLALAYASPDRVPMIPAEICRAALCEAGRPDLARNIGTNRLGHPMRTWTAYYGSDAELVARAFVLAYNDERLTAAERALVAELRTELEPQYPGVRHWSPLLGRWCVDFEPDQWIGAA